MLTIFTAHMDADLAGIATTLIVPARLPVAMAKAPADGELTAACDPAAQLGLQ
jgi:hypothetical protein